jgi:menaquinone-dependent protoporphyrinogen oxidase
MSRILVLYGTTDGHTSKIARTIGETLRTRGAEVDVLEAGSADPDPADYAGIVIAASVHAGGYQRPVRSWIRAHLVILGTRPTAFVSVCLGVLQPDPKVQQQVAAVMNRFLSTVDWRPTVTKIVAGALPYTRYNWFKRRLMKRIVAKAGGDTDTSRDYEYTDWVDLRAFAEQFAPLLLEAKAA